MKTQIFDNIIRIPEFEKDLKKLLKRYSSLEEDLKIFIQAQLVAYHKHNLNNHSIFPIQGIGISTLAVYKAKKFACKSLKGKGANSGMRVIYSYNKESDLIELIEIYYKGDQENEDRERIMKLYATLDVKSKDKTSLARISHTPG